MKKIILMVMVISIFLVGSMTFIGCDRVDEIKDTAMDNMEKDKNLPQYELNRDNYNEISYDGKTYKITKDIIDLKKVKDAIGKVGVNITLDENGKELTKKELRKVDVFGVTEEKEYRPLYFGWVHEIEGIDKNTSIAVMINSEYHKANSIS